NVTATVEKCLRLGGSSKEDRGSRACSVLDVRHDIQAEFRGPSRGMYDIHDVALDLVVDIHLVDGTAQLENLRRGENGLDGQVWFDDGHSIQDFQLLVLVGVGQL